MSQHEQWTPFARVYNPLKAGSIDGTDTEPHDHAIVRAMEAHYKPNKLVVGDPRSTLFVARLNPATTEDSLKNFFEKYGKIVHCRLVQDVVTGFSKCYGFVEFKDRYAAIEAHRDCNKIILEGHEIFVDYECERILKGWVPRRLGGGFSGKKESGQLRFGGRDRPFRKPIVLNKSQPTSKDNERRDDRDDRRDDHHRNSHSDRHADRKYSSDRKHRKEHYHSDRYSHRDRHEGYRRDSHEGNSDEYEYEDRRREHHRSRMKD